MKPSLALLKLASHAAARGKERLNLPPESIKQIQSTVDKMWYSGGNKKLYDNFFHVPLVDQDNNTLGHAAFTRIGKNPFSSRLILSTILSKEMKPKGTNIGHLVDTEVKADFPIAPRLSAKDFKKVPDNI